MAKSEFKEIIMRKLLLLLTLCLSFVSYATTQSDEQSKDSSSSDKKVTVSPSDNPKSTPPKDDDTPSSPISPSMAPAAGSEEPGP